MDQRFLTLATVTILVSHSFATDVWRDDYFAAYETARSEGKSLLVWFHPEPLQKADQDFAGRLGHERFATALQSLVCVKVPQSTKVQVKNEPTWLLGHPAFGELLKSPGLAIVDLRDKENAHYGKVVSVYPFRSGKPPDADRLQVLLELPPGTLTQRTLIFAVRTHHDRPKSTTGVFDPLLASETQKHSVHQASITLQGHHNWDRRFQLISAKLPDRLLAQEVCAESWPGQNLVEAAEECVDSWRQSSGHWSAVSSAHPRYGYDMKRGRNGVWYATGIFGKR